MVRTLQAAMLLVTLCACSSEETPDAESQPVLDAPAPAGETRRAPPRPPQTTLLRALPADTLGVLHLPTIEGAVQLLRGTVFGAFLGGIDAVDVGLGLRPYYEEWIDAQPAGSVVPAPWKDILKTLRSICGEAMVAVLDVQGFERNGSDVRALLGLTVHGAGDAADSVVDMFVPLLARSLGLQLRRTGGLWSLRNETTGATLEWGVQDDVMLFGIGEGTAREAFKRMRTSQAQFEIPSADRIFGGQDIARIHVNLQAIFQRFGLLLPTVVQEALESVRLTRIADYTGAISVQDKRLLTSSFLRSPGGHDFITRMLRTNPVDYKMLDVFPPGVDSFTLFTVNPSWIAKNLEVGLPPREAMRVKQILDPIIDAEGLAAFGPQCAYFSLPQIGNAPTGPEALLLSLTESAWVIQVNEPDVARRLLRRLSEQIPTRRRYQIGLAEAVTYSLGLEPLPNVEFAPSFGLTGEHLFFTLSERSLRRALEGGSEKTAADYRLMVGRAPESAVSVSYDSMQKSGLLASALRRGLATSRAMGLQIPMADKFRALELAMTKLSPALSWVRADENGVFTHTDSPTGSMSGVGGVTGIGLIAGIAVPNLLQARTQANESAALSTLQILRSAQEQYRLRGFTDNDKDDIGEYGFLRDLIDPRSGSPFMPRIPGAGGRFLRHGYLFRVYLPGRHGKPIGETGRPGEPVDANLSESFFLVVAWPVEKGKSGRRAFILNTDGVVFGCAQGPYGGRNAPAPDLLSFEPGNMVSRPLDDGVTARDGLRWQRVR